MRRIAPLALAALLAACAGSPTSADPASRFDSGLIGSTGGRSENTGDDNGNMGSGCCPSQSSGLVGSIGGRAEDSGLLGPGGGRTRDSGLVGSGVGAMMDTGQAGSGGRTTPPDTTGPVGAI